METTDYTDSRFDKNGKAYVVGNGICGDKPISGKFYGTGSQPVLNAVKKAYQAAYPAGISLEFKLTSAVDHAAFEVRGHVKNSSTERNYIWESANVYEM